MRPGRPLRERGSSGSTIAVLRQRSSIIGSGMAAQKSMSAIIIGIILGGMAEQNFVGSLIMSDGNFNIFYTRPLCLFFLVAAVLSLLSPVLGKLFKKA